MINYTATVQKSKFLYTSTSLNCNSKCSVKTIFFKKVVTNIVRMASRNHQLTDTNVGTHLPPIKVPAARLKEEMIPADLAEIIERTAWRWSYTQFCTSCRTTVQWKRRTNFKHGDHSGSPNVNSHVIYIIYTNSVLVYSDLSDAKATNEQRISICSGALVLAGQLGAGVNVACSRLSDSCAFSIAIHRTGCHSDMGIPIPISLAFWHPRWGMPKTLIASTLLNYFRL